MQEVDQASELQTFFQYRKTPSHCQTQSPMATGHQNLPLWKNMTHHEDRHCQPKIQFQKLLDKVIYWGICKFPRKNVIVSCNIPLQTI